MATDASVNKKIGFLDANYWTARKWFTLIVVLLLVWTGVYLFAHSKYGYKGYEYAHFTTAQVKQISRILNPDLYNRNQFASSGTNSNSISSNSSDVATVSSPDIPNEEQAVTLAACDLACRINKAELFIKSEFDNMIIPGQLNEIKQYINTFGPQEVSIYLVDYRLKVNSYFWLTGAMVYTEIIFWVIIGVLCSLLFSISSVARKTRADENNGFNSQEIIYQVAKLLYAPFIAIVLVLAYSYYKDGTTLNINTSEGVIVFAFITGFYSGRVMNFLDRLKQLILPAAYDGKESSVPETNTAAVQEPKPFINPLLQEEKSQLQTTGIAVDKNGEIIETVINKKPADDREIGEVDIDLRLDGSGLFDDEKSELQELGFNRAIVTLHNVNGKDIIAAKRVSDKNPARFIANGVKPGIYIARATLSQRLKDDHIINLFGEKTSYVTVDKPGLELYVKKYESVD